MLGRCVSIQGSSDDVAALLGADYLKIYTDWANYYLERAKSKKKVTDLSADCRDGLLLADVIEAVTSFKVPDLVKKPKNQQQMYDNVNSCLNVLRSQAVCGLDNITTNDICAGRLKAVLALFFALSRYKQQSKQLSNSTTPNANVVLGSTTNTAVNVGGASTVASVTNATNTGTTTAANNQQQNQTQQQQQHFQNGNETMLNRQIPTAYSKTNGGTAIPLPATVMVQRRCPPDKIRPLPPTPNHTPSIPGLGKSGAEFNSGRPSSPPTSNHTIQSLKTANNNGLRPPTAKTSHASGIPPPSGLSANPTNSGGPALPQQKHSMLDKLKLFNKEKQQQQNAANAASTKLQVQSKRTSSSSGFSSARSERSDSSLSLNDGHISQIKPPAVSVTSGKAKISAKQSKLMAAQMKKEQTKASKLDKKEKSPARSLHKEDFRESESKNSTMGRTKNSLPRVSEKNTSKSSSKASLSSKSDSKSSLIVPPTKGLCSPNGANTGLPKPIAAIKGTSKLPQAPVGSVNADNRVRGMSNSNSQHEMLKREKSDISSMQQQHISGETKSKETPQHQPHIVKPVPIFPEPGSKPPYYANASNISQQQQHQLQLQQQRQQAYQQQQQAYFNQQQHQQQQQEHAAIYSSNSRLQQPKSATSPSSSAPTSRKLEYNSGPGILSSPQRSPLRGSLQQQSPDSPSAHLHSLSNHSSAASHHHTKFHTIPSRIDTIYEEKKPTSLLPMPPLLRGYNSHVTLPTRGVRGGGAHNYVAEFVETEISQGYCSDGDSLRVSASARLAQRAAATARRYHDIDNGYLSDGSGSVGHHGMVLGSGMSAAAHTKHFLSMMRARTQLPTTIEERIRNSRGSLDSIGTAPPSSAASQASSSGGSNPKMDSANGGGGGSGNTSANASPQHHNHTHQHSQHAHHSSGVVGVHRSNSRNGRDNWTKMPEPLNGHNKSEKTEKSSPSRRSVGGGSGSSSKQGSPSGRTKGVPPSFGYVKRANGSATATAEQQNITMMGAMMSGQLNGHNGGGGGGGGTPGGGICGGMGRTAHVSAVPRTATSASGRKVSGGTQTLPNDMTKTPPSTQHRSFSLTGPGATQLSQSIRERLATGSHSLPKPGTDLHLFQHRISNRPGKMIDGSLSDTQTYAEVKPEYSTYAMWLKHSNTAGSRLSEGESLENMQIGGSPAMSRHSHKMLQHRNAAAAVAAAAAAAANGSGGGGAAGVGGMPAGVSSVAGNESPYVQSPRLNRSNSIRSTKSEKMYPSMLSRGPDVEIEPYYCLPVNTLTAQNGSLAAQMAAAAAAAMSQVTGQPTANATGAPVAWSQPTSPTPINRGFGGTLSPTHPAGMSGMASLMGTPGNVNANATGHRLTYPKKNDEVHGSAASLLSGGSSLYGSAEERQANEIRRLKRELLDAREQVLSLSSQLSTNVSREIVANGILIFSKS